MSEEVLVTSYLGPDLDGTACAIAYAEYLQKQGQSVKAAIFGMPHREAEFVTEIFHIAPPLMSETIIAEGVKFILVDASDTVGISSYILPEQVIEICQSLIL